MLTCFNRTKAVLLISSRATLALKASCKALCTKHSKLEQEKQDRDSRSKSNFHPVQVLPVKLPILYCAHCQHRGSQGGKNRQCLGLRLSPDDQQCYHNMMNIALNYSLALLLSLVKEQWPLTTDQLTKKIEFEFNNIFRSFTKNPPVQYEGWK